MGFLRKKFLTIPLYAALFILGFLSTYLILGKFKKVKSNIIPSPQTQQDSVTPLQVETSQKLSVLLLGYGGANHDGGNLTDSIILLSINTSNKKALAVSIPRDLWIENINNKINAAYSDGGGNKAKSIISQITGLPINYFVAVDFTNFETIIDNLGGIEVNVPKTFTDNFYPIRGEENNTCGYSADQINTFKNKYSGFDLEKQFTCRYEVLHFDQGPAKLDGKTALKFVRSRHGDSDFSRSERQFAVLSGIEQKLISLNALKNSSTIIESLLKIVTTDLDIATINKLLPLFTKPDDYKLSQVHLTEDNYLISAKNSAGAFILLPKAGNNNFTQIQNDLKKAFLD